MNKQILLAVLCVGITCTACGPGGTGKPGDGNTSSGNGGNGAGSGSGSSGGATAGNTGGTPASDNLPYNGAGWTFEGRVIPGDSNAAAAQIMSWPDSAVIARFKGATSATVKLDADKTAAFEIVVDGQTPVPLTQSSQQVTGLDASATHTLQLIKKTETAYGNGTFNGITLDDGGTFVAPPTAAAHRIEVIGDSISCGYGDLGDNALCAGSASNEDSTAAYGPIAAASLSADLHVTAWSGQGLTRSNTGDTSLTLPMIWRRAVASDSSSTYDFSWVPQVVVINLGTNDFYTGIPEATVFESAYAQFISEIRGKYGASTHIFCAVGPMLGGDSLTTAEQYVKSVVSTANSGGDKNVHYLEFPVQNVDSTSGAGAACDYHPNLATQRSMALDVLVPAIKSALGW